MIRETLETLAEAFAVTVMALAIIAVIILAHVLVWP